MPWLQSSNNARRFSRLVSNFQEEAAPRISNLSAASLTAGSVLENGKDTATC